MTKKFIVVTTALIIAITSCKISSGEFRSVKFYYKFQFMQIDPNRLIDYYDSTEVFQYQDYIIYRDPYINSKTIINMNKKGETLSEESNTEVKHQYIIYKLGSQRIKVYSSLKDTIGIDSNLNQFLTNNSLFRQNLVTSIPEKHKLIIAKGNLRVYQYTGIKKDVTYYDTAYLYFDRRFKEAPFSISLRIDSAFNRKLAKVRYIFNPTQQDNIMIPRREFLFELRPTDPYNYEDLKSLVKRYQKSKSKD